tara:strand:- start:381 stop:584 length:204 start_codon:yes stop_codon:yes gene_type:complete
MVFLTLVVVAMLTVLVREVVPPAVTPSSVPNLKPATTAIPMLAVLVILIALGLEQALSVATVKSVLN